ncbi:MAG: OsmC family protein [Anaerolineae bacterium]|jgi:putative redox protein|nr:OsmC family protein [Anaerolineae bacterium]MBT7191763.1 OsmC family protein [Anaerolineae bacterium]MBT7989121.1 OsmC family protein [Anaerolineae bacterium]
MDAKVIWDHGMSFAGTSESGFTVPLGTVPAVGGENDGFKPMELMAISLAGCTAMDVISILRKKRQEITAYEVSVHADVAETHPRVFVKSAITYDLTGKNIDEKAVRRAIQLSADRYCPAQGMLDKVMPIGLLYEIYEAGDDGERSLVVKGEYKRE